MFDRRVLIALAGAMLCVCPFDANAIIQGPASGEAPVSAPYEGTPVHGPRAPVDVDGIGVPNTVIEPAAQYRFGTAPIANLTWIAPEAEDEGDDDEADIEKGFRFDAPFAQFQVPGAKVWGGVTGAIDTINFDTNSPTGSRFIPADPHAAVGPNQIVTVTNVMIQFHNKTGGAPLFSNTLQSFFSPAGFATPPTTFTFDPKVLYDSQSSRWLVVTLEKTATASFIFLAVSDDNNPTGNWFFTRIDAKENIGGGGDCWLDYPGFAFDEEAVYVTGNMFRLSNNASCSAARLYVVAKTGFYSGTAATVSRLNPFAGGGIATTIQPARILGTPPAGATGTWLMSYSGLSNGTQEFVQAVRIDSPLTAPVFTVFQRSLGDIEPNGGPGGTVSGLVDSPQSGSAILLESNDQRALDAVWSNNTLWTTFTHGANSAPDTGQPTSRWVRMTTPGETVADQGKVGGETIATGAHTTFSSIAVNSWGAMVLGFSGTATTVFPGAYAVSRRANDAAGATSNPVTIHAGVDSYVRTFTVGSTGANRWGDYSAVATDPVDQCFWVYNKWAWTHGTVLSGEDGRWNSTIAKVCVCEGNEATTDNDFDGKCADIDNCPTVSNNDQADGDADTRGNACDNCPSIPNLTQLNSDSDTFGDACDNCPFITNQSQQDTDGDGIGDACETLPPVFTPAAAISRQRGSVAGASATVGVVTDADTPVGTIAVTQVAGGTSTGVSAASITNTSGTIGAIVTASCTATAGTLRFQASDGANTSTGDLTVNLTNNANPTIAYTNSAVNGGAGTTINPSTALSDNGTATAALLSAGTYTGGISVAANGDITLTSAAPIGAHTISIRATDNCGAQTDVSFTLTVNNTAPTFTPGSAISRQQGSTPPPAGPVGTVSDAQQAVGSLTVTQIAGGTSTGIAASSIVNSSGTINAVVSAGCTATTGTLRFQVSDGSLTGNGDLQVNVTANAAPTLAYTNTSINGGSGTTINPSTALTDNGTASAALLSAGTYTGGISVATNGDITLTNAAPVGAHTISVRATDNCGAQTDRSFTLTVNNTAPTFTPGSAISRQQGTSPFPPAGPVGTVTDAQQAVGSLTVTQVAGGTSTGVAASSIVNTSGTINAVVSASCTATTGTLRFQVSDGSLTGTGDLQVNITANSAPTIAYANTSVNGGSGTTINPSTALSDNGTANATLLSAGTYTGGISVATNGDITLTNAAPVGAHTITIRATDNCNANTDVTFQLTVNNTAPSIATGSGITRQQGTAGTLSTIATVSDPQQGAGTLAVTQVAGGTSSGVTASGITNTSGTIAATIAASCTATGGTLRFRVSDGTLTSDGDLPVTVNANTPPTVSYAPAQLDGGTGTIVNPATLTDNGTASAALQSAGTYTGGISVAANGVVTITNAAPVGSHNITIRATDNCGATSDATLQLVVNNTAPSIAAGSAVSRQQGSAGTTGTIGTVSDPQQAAGALSVAQIAGGTATGITTTGITNSNGTISGTLAASCTATSGTVRYRVTDDGALTATADLQVNVQANTPPALGIYAPVFVGEAGGTTVVPVGLPSDNGSVTALTASAAPPSFTGTLSAALATGDVTVANANPPGLYTVTVTATDNCGANGNGTFPLTVVLDAMFSNGFE